MVPTSALLLTGGASDVVPIPSPSIHYRLALGAGSRVSGSFAMRAGSAAVLPFRFAPNGNPSAVPSVQMAKELRGPDPPKGISNKKNRRLGRFRAIWATFSLPAARNTGNGQTGTGGLKKPFGAAENVRPAAAPKRKKPALITFGLFSAFPFRLMPRDCVT